MMPAYLPSAGTPPAAAPQDARAYQADLVAMRSATWARLDALNAHVRESGIVTGSRSAALGYELAALLVKVDNVLLLLEMAEGVE